MGAITGFAEQELGPPGHHLLAERDEDGEQVLQIHRLRTAGIQRQDVGREIRLQRREPVELVQHHVGHRFALQLDDDAIAVTVGLVAQVADALDLLLFHEIGDALDHRRLVHLIGNLGDDDRFAIFPDRVDRNLAAHHDRAAAEMVGAANALAAQDDAAGREVRSGNDVDQLVDRERRIIDQRHAGVDDLAEIVRRDVGRHADGDAAGAIDQQVREPGRQNRRLLLRVVVVRLEIDGVHVDVGQNGKRRLRQPCLGISIGRRRIAVHRAEIALAVDQRHPQREVLRHADHRVVNRLVAMRMIFTDHVADDAGGLDVFLVRRVSLLMHRIEDAPVHRLEPVARVGQRTRHDHAHRVIEVGLLHLVENGNGTNI
ncbi:hypothetical protein ACVWW1_002305 [Bradyrhizobium sp. JR3.5]